MTKEYRRIMLFCAGRRRLSVDARCRRSIRCSSPSSPSLIPSWYRTSLHELYFRSLFLVSFIIFGIIIANVLAQAERSSGRAETGAGPGRRGKSPLRIDHCRDRRRDQHPGPGPEGAVSEQVPQEAGGRGQNRRVLLPGLFRCRNGLRGLPGHQVVRRTAAFMSLRKSWSMHRKPGNRDQILSPARSNGKDRRGYRGGPRYHRTKNRTGKADAFFEGHRRGHGRDSDHRPWTASVIYSNKAIEKIYGFTPEELKGIHVNDMNADKEFASRVIIPQIRQYGRWSGEVMVLHKKGHTFPIWLSTSLVTDDAGSPIAMVGIIRDMTERKKAEDILNRHREQLRETGRRTDERALRRPTKN